MAPAPASTGSRRVVLVYSGGLDTALARPIIARHQMALARRQGAVATAEKPFSTDENLMHRSYVAGVFEDPSVAPRDARRRKVHRVILRESDLS